MRSSHIVTSAIGSLLIALVACSSPNAATTGAGVDTRDAGGPTGTGADNDASDPSATTDGGGSTDMDSSVMNPPDATIVGAGNDHCTDATSIPLSAANQRVSLLATTVGATHDVDAPCASDQSPDVFYKFAFSKRVFIYADTFGASWNTTLFLLKDDCTAMNTNTTAGDSVCNEGACGTQQGRIVALLEPGYYRLGLTGRGGAVGAATIHFEWTVAGGGNIAPLPQGTSVQSGTTGGDGNIDGLDSSCIAAGPEDSYWWARCPGDTGGALTASTCGGTTWESIVDVQLPSGAPSYKCAVDTCGTEGATVHSTIPAGAGLAVVSVDGQKGNDFGNYVMNVTRP
jgi:hypothetical protein